MVLVMLSEFVVDWVKHAFITKFNEIPSEVITLLFSVAVSLLVVLLVIEIWLDLYWTAKCLFDWVVCFISVRNHGSLSLE